MSKRNQSEPLTIEQLDGTVILLSACTCPPLFVSGEYSGSIDCPIDKHRVVYLSLHQEFDDNGRVILRDDVSSDE